MDDFAKLLIAFGIAIAFVGALLYLFSRLFGAGRLPGDFVVQTGNLTCLVPVATSIVLSILLTILLNLILRALNK